MDTIKDLHFKTVLGVFLAVNKNDSQLFLALLVLTLEQFVQTLFFCKKCRFQDATVVVVADDFSYLIIEIDYILFLYLGYRM